MFAQSRTAVLTLAVLAAVVYMYYLYSESRRLDARSQIAIQQLGAAQRVTQQQLEAVQRRLVLMQAEGGGRGGGAALGGGSLMFFPVGTQSQVSCPSMLVIDEVESNSETEETTEEDDEEDIEDERLRQVLVGAFVSDEELRQVSVVIEEEVEFPPEVLSNAVEVESALHGFVDEVAVAVIAEEVAVDEVAGVVEEVAVEEAAVEEVAVEEAAVEEVAVEEVAVEEVAVAVDEADIHQVIVASPSLSEALAATADADADAETKPPSADVDEDDDDNAQLAPSAVSFTATDAAIVSKYAAMRVEDLRSLLRSQGADARGGKAVLVSRLDSGDLPK